MKKLSRYSARIVSGLLIILLIATSVTSNASLLSMTAEAAEKKSESQIEAASNSGDSDEVSEHNSYRASDKDLEAPVYNPTAFERAKLAAVPDRYAPEDTSFSSVSDQMATYPSTRRQGVGSCWAHATTALTEYFAVKKLGQSKSLNYSELHLAYFTNYDEVDPIGGTAGDDFGFQASDYLDYGGNVSKGLRSLLRGQGIANDSGALAYTTASSMRVKGAIDSSYAYGHNVANVYGYNRISWSTDNTTTMKQVKAAIQEYGAVSMSYFHCSGTDTDCKSAGHTGNTASDDKSYYGSNHTSTNHAVTIVGWDDNYSASKFKTTPAGNGAWLVRNSWSTYSEESIYSYFWISYYDTSLTKAAYVITEEKMAANSYANNYEYDGGLDTDTFGSRNKVANVFTVAGTANAATETIKAVSVSMDNSSGAGKSGTIKIYANLTDIDNPESGTLVSTQDFSTTYAGVYLVGLTTPIVLPKGAKYSVVVNTPNAYVDKEKGYSNGRWFYSKVTASQHQSYRYNGSSWEEVTTVTSGTTTYGNFCIKAFSDNGGTLTDTSRKISLKANGGGTDNIIDSITTDTYTLPTAASLSLKKKGYTFNGWNTKSDGTGTSYADGATVTGIALGTTLVLYARWKANKVTINFDANGGIGTKASQTVDYGYAVDTTTTGLSNGSKIFKEWNTKADGTGDPYKASGSNALVSMTEASSVTLYAIWVDEFEVSNGTLVKYWGCDSVVSIPSGISKIGNQAFLNNKTVTKVLMSNSVTSIGHYAFYGCINLEDVTFSNKLTTINSYVFQGATKLKKVTLPASITTCVSAFNNSNVEEVVFASGITTIPNGIFKNHTSLKKVVMPNTVTRIGNEAFYGCTGLTDVTFSNSLTDVGESSFNGCTGLTSLNLPDSVKNIESNAFAGTTGLTEVVLPKNLELLMAAAFYNSGVKTVTIYKKITNINNYVFGNNSTDPAIECNLTTIKGVAGTYAQTYATTKGKTFVAIPDPDICTHSDTTHREKRGYVAASKKAQGYSGDIYCTDCGNKIEDGAPLAKLSCSHPDSAKVTRNQTDATYTTTGYTGDTWCTDCETRIATGTTIPKLTCSHPEDKYFVSGYIAPTYKKAGQTGTTYCSQCRAIVSGNSSIPKLVCPHSHKTTRNAKSATYQAAGYSGDVWCTDCETQLTTGAVIPKLVCSHARTYVTGAYAANYSYAGYTGNTYCSDCGAFLYYGSAIPKLEPWYPNGMQCIGGVWRYVENNHINYSYTGMANNAYGWWYYRNGTIDFNYCGYGTNQWGTWLYWNGNIAFWFSGMIAVDGTWRYVEGGKLNPTYTGMACNEWGWWYYTNGTIDWNYTGMACNQWGWWYYQNGRLNFNYCGWGFNDYGAWLYWNGNIAFWFTGWFWGCFVWGGHVIW